VRSAIVFILFACSIVIANAQEQERRLVDRLLQPDATLHNTAQNKKFGAKSKLVEKQGSVQSFSISQTAQTKQCADQREYSASEFAAHHFRDGELSSTMQARAERVKRYSVNDGTGTLQVRDFTDSKKKIASTEFAGERPFLEQGKSQKSLSQHDTPLTIEQVRELLNKNK
jgi:hypothetical protein